MKPADFVRGNVSVPARERHLWLGQPINQYGEPWYRFERVLSLVDRSIPNVRKSKWLDIGCQLGQFIRLLQARYDVSASGIDQFLSSETIEVARKYFKLNLNDEREILDG